MRTEHYRNTAPGVAELVEVFETYDAGRGVIRCRHLDPKEKLLDDRLATEGETDEHHAHVELVERMELLEQLRATDPDTVADPTVKALLKLAIGRRQPPGREDAHH